MSEITSDFKFNLSITSVCMVICNQVMRPQHLLKKVKSFIYFCMSCQLDDKSN